MLARFLAYRHEGLDPDQIMDVVESSNVTISCGFGSHVCPLGQSVLISDVDVDPKTNTCVVKILVQSRLDVSVVGRSVTEVEMVTPEPPQHGSAEHSVHRTAAWYLLTPPLGGEALLEIIPDPTVVQLLAKRRNDRHRLQGLETLTRADSDIKGLRSALRMNQSMIEEVEARLAENNAQKLEWLHRMRSMEVERKRLMSEASVQYARLEEEWRLEYEKIVYVDCVPKLRDLRRKFMEKKARARMSTM
eukprot:PhM_4_TR12297/c0_g1_i3/m.2300